MGRKLLKTVQTITTFRNPLADPVGTRRGPPLVRRPQFENRCHKKHTHPFNGPYSGTTRVSRYQKGKTNLVFTEARDSEWQWHQLGHMQVCTSLQTDNHASTPPLSFSQAGCPSCCPNNSVKALKAHHNTSGNLCRLLEIILILHFEKIHNPLSSSDRKRVLELAQRKTKPCSPDSNLQKYFSEC